MTTVDYEHGGDLAAFEEYSSRETPIVFLRMLENRASTNRLTAEIRNDLVDIVQECRTYIYRRYHQEAMNNALGTLATNRQPKAAPSSLRFADSQTGNTTSEASSQPQADFGVPMDHDPDVFESIFENEFQATLEAGYYDHNHRPEPMLLC